MNVRVFWPERCRPLFDGAINEARAEPTRAYLPRGTSVRMNGARWVKSSGDGYGRWVLADEEPWDPRMPNRYG